MKLARLHLDSHAGSETISKREEVRELVLSHAFRARLHCDMSCARMSRGEGVGDSNREAAIPFPFWQIKAPGARTSA